MQTLAFIAAIIFAGFVGKFLFRHLFADMEDFWDCVRHAFTPDIISMFRGEYGEDLANSFRLGVFALGCFLSGLATFLGIMKIGG